MVPNPNQVKTEKKTNRAPPPPFTPSSSFKDRRERITTLRTAYTIWSARSTTSADALHASRVLRAILNRIDSYSSAAPSSSSTGLAGPVTQTPIIASSAQDLASCASNDYGNASSDSAAMQHVVLPLSNTSHNMHAWTADETLPGQQQQEDMSFAMPNFEDMFDNIDMLDWVRSSPSLLPPFLKSLLSLVSIGIYRILMLFLGSTHTEFP